MAKGFWVEKTTGRVLKTEAHDDYEKNALRESESRSCNASPMCQLDLVGYDIWLMGFNGISIIYGI